VLRIAALLIAVATSGCPATGQPPPPETVEPAAAQLDELSIEPVREFECLDVPGGTMVVDDALPGSPGSVLELLAIGGPCRFHLVHRDGGGRETQLSTTPGGYLLTAGAGGDDGSAIVCASNIAHRAIAGSVHAIDAVTIECAARTGGRFGRLLPVVVPDGAWAAWPREVRAAGGGRFVLRYARDFSFQFLNMSDRGRPPEDGLYEIELVATGDRLTAIAPAAMVDGRQNPLRDTEVVSWTPTSEEMEELAGLIDFGCPGDGNGDGRVDQADLDLVLLYWGQASSDGDLDHDAFVGQGDLDLVLLHWGAVCDR
jgi:hypothetical protein